MSSMVIECISRGSDSLRDSANAKPGSSVEGSSNVDTASSRIPNSTISAFPVSSYQQLEEIGVDSGAETISVVPVGSEATAATAVPSIRIPLSNNLQPNKAPDRRQPLVNKAGNSVSRSSCKRKPALPRKRPSTMQEPVIISAETGEAVDDVLPTEDSNGSLGNVLYDRNYRSFAVAINNSRGTADETQISFNGPGDLDGVAPVTNDLHCGSGGLRNDETYISSWETCSNSSASGALVIDTRSNSFSSSENGTQNNRSLLLVNEPNELADAAERSTSPLGIFGEAVETHLMQDSVERTDYSVDRGNKPQLTIDSKTSKSSEDMLSQQNGINGSSVQNLNDVLILNAAMNSFLWASAAAGTDAANAFITPEMFVPLSTAGLSSFLGVPCVPSLTDKPSDSTLLKTTTFLSTAAATPVKENSPIRDNHPSASSTIDAVDSKTTMNLIKPLTLKLVPEVMECVDICESSPNYITLKPLVPNSFLPPCETVLPSSETSPLTNPVEVVKEISTNDGILSTDQQQNANMLLLEAAAAATAAGTMQDLIGSLPRNGDVASLDITNNSKCQQPEVPSTSVTAEVITTGTANIVFNGKDGTIRKHDRRLKGRFALNGKATTVGEHVVNMLNLSDTKRRTNKAPKSKIGDTRINVKRRADDATLINAARAITKEEKIDLDELENFAQTFKKQRIKFGFTQGDVGLALGRRYGTDFSQTTISRFEALNLSFKNMCKLRPLLKEWLEDAEAALASGATVSDLLDASSKESAQQRPMPVVHLPLDKPNPAVIANNMCNNSSRIASDGSPSPNGSIVVNAGGNGNGIPLKKRRKRTNLDLAQRSALDAYFDMNPRPDHDRMAEIAGLVGLDRDVVRVWFCNRRQKVRKE